MIAKQKSKTVHESFSRFFESPTRESLRDLLKEHLGETRNCDFKESWPEHSSIAKHLIGLGNVGGGCLIVGVKEGADKSLAPIGLTAIKDKADIISGVKLFLPEPLLSALEIADYLYESSDYPALIGKKFQVLFLHPRNESVPFVAQRGGSGVRLGAIYVRREGATEEASYEDVQSLIRRRLDAAPQTLQARNIKEHLEELKVLYSEIPKLHNTNSVFGDMWDAAILGRSMGYSVKPNPTYPIEDYEAYVARAIVKKKSIIDSLLGIIEDKK